MCLADSGMVEGSILSRTNRESARDQWQLVALCHAVEAVDLAFLVELAAQVGQYACHVAGAEHFDAGLFQRIVRLTRLSCRRGAGGMDVAIMVAQFQRDGIGGTPLALPARALPVRAMGTADGRVFRSGQLRRLGRQPAHPACGRWRAGVFAVARLKSSLRLCSLSLRLIASTRVWHSDGFTLLLAGRNIFVETALIVFRHGVTLGFIAFVEEGEPKGEADIAENLGILGPGDHRSR